MTVASKCRVSAKKLKLCAEIALRDCLAYKGRERITVLTDRPATAQLPRVLFETAREMEGNAALLVVPETNAVLTDAPLRHFMSKSEILLVCTSAIFPLVAREEALQQGSRVILMHTITDELAIRTIPIDYEHLRQRLDAIAKPLQSMELNITSRMGTDFRFSCKGRPVFEFDGLCRNAGECDSLPAGSIYSSPVENTAEGTIVIDTPGYQTGFIRTPIKLVVKRGVVIDVFGGEETRRLRKLIRAGGKNSSNLAEIGFGLNPNARISRYPIESERAAGSATIGLGRNTQMGGAVHSSVHLDIGVMSRVTLKAGGRILMQDGKLSL